MGGFGAMIAYGGNSGRFQVVISRLSYKAPSQEATGQPGLGQQVSGAIHCVLLTALAMERPLTALVMERPLRVLEKGYGLRIGHGP